MVISAQDIPIEINRSSSVPVFRQLADHLKAHILSGRIPAGSRLPPETELATALGVTRVTLHKSLNTLGALNLISQVPHRGTYICEKQRSPIRLGVLCLPYTGNDNMFLGTLMLEMCQQVGVNSDIELAYINGRDFLEKPSDSSFISAAHCQGLIIPIAFREFCLRLDSSCYDDLPMVFFNRYDQCLRGRRYAICSERRAIASGVEYLRRCGHRRIAYISQDNQDLAVLSVRNHEFRECKGDSDVMLLGTKDETWFDFSRRVIPQLTAMKNSPTAILTPSAVFSAGVMQGIADCRLRVPGDLSLLGFDPATNCFPYLSTIDQPCRQIVRKAFELLTNTCRHGQVYRTHTFSFAAEIHDRGSIARR